MEKKQVLPQTFYIFHYPGDLTEVVASVKQASLDQNDFNYVSSNPYILEGEEFSDIRNWVMECLEEVMDEQDYRFDIKLTQSWITFADKGMWHHRHSHPNGFLSGILYLTPSNCHTWFSGPGIWFTGGKERLFPGLAWDQPHFQEVIHKEPTEVGKLVIFPASLPHSVDEHRGEEPRYTVSFNTFPVGKFGVEDFTSAVTVK